MKTKLFVQIIVLAIIGSATVQAQENINRLVKKEVRKAKRDIRKSKKDIKKSMKDVEWDAVYFDESKLEDLFENPIWVHKEEIDHYSDAFDRYHDILKDFEVDLGDFEVDLDELEELEHLDVVMPLMHVTSPDIDIRIPEQHNVKYYYRESGNILSLSKDLEDVSIGKDFFFNVKQEHSSLDMLVDGSLNSGELIITVTKPNGELFQEFHVSPLADVDWSQQIDLEEEGNVYAGKWKINLSGTKATGNYNIRFKAR